jgi:uncharacterized membrane protein
MKPTLISAICFLLVLITIKTKASTGDQWELELEREGIRVYTQLEGDSPYKQIKVTTTINAPVEKVMEILLAFNHYSRWMNHVDESYLLNQSDSNYYVFILEDADWPMQNRYQVSRLNVKQSMNKSLIRFKSIPNFIEKRTDAIQIKQHEGYWELEDRTEHQCTLEYVLVQNPGGHVPPWLANFNAVENPYQSVSRLKELAENNKITP